MVCSISKELINKTIDFHGHNCPGLTIGIRVSELAMERLDIQNAEAPLCVTETDMCGFDAMVFIDGKRMYKKELCMGCDLCVENCPEKALSLYIDSAKPLPLDLDQIKLQAATAI